MVAIEKNPEIRTLMSQRSTFSKNGTKIPRRKAVYPLSAERELARAFLIVAQDIRKVSKPFIDRMAAIYKIWADENIRVDARVSLQDGIGAILEEYGSAIDDGIDWEVVSGQIKKSSKVAQRLSISDWKTLVKDALNTEIDEPFYMETTEDLINKWTYESVQSITRYPKDYLGKIQEIITWGYTTKQPLVNVYRRLEKATGDTRSHVRMLARDLMGTLNYQMTRYEHESMGASQYVWISRRDSRVRPCHRKLDGHIFDWNNPPAQWYPTVSRGIVYTGEYAHPGQAYGCRCRANPVFDEKAVEAIKANSRFYVQ